jgi:hypothetical protein
MDGRARRELREQVREQQRVRQRVQEILARGPPYW